MSEHQSSRRVAIFGLVAVLIVVATATYVVVDAMRRSEARDAAPRPATTSIEQVESGPRIVFRNVTLGNDNGLVAMVPLDDPAGPRALTDVVCDRVDVAAQATSCLATERGVVTRYTWKVLAPDWSVAQEYPLAGIPSRTRLSDDGTLVASTSFVTGHSYMQVGFSTATEIHRIGGRDYGNLEQFQLVIDGKQVAPVDRNLWGVTFVDDRTFYATAATGGRTYLVKGDLDRRRMVSLRENAECPSVSPDRTKVAYKVVTDEKTKHWTLAVLDLASGDETLLTGQRATVDDQVEWLDDTHLLYGLPRSDEAGVSDVWSIRATADAEPELLVENAWSPAVVR